MVLDTAVKRGRDILQPCLRELDQDPPELVNGQVIVHPVVKTFMRECGEGGWIGAHAPFERQGQQLPTMIINAFMFIFGAANYSASVYPMLTNGAERLRQSVEKLRQVTDFLLTLAAKGNIELFLADSTLYLELFGITAVGWQWLLQGTVAQTKLLESQSESQATFYKGKLWTMKYFFHYEMPKIEGLASGY